METAIAVGDGKLSNENLGGIYRRVMEIIRRINEGKIRFSYVMKALQMIVEGRDSVEPCKRYHQGEFVEFKRPSKKERIKSFTPYGSGLPESVTRLEWPQYTAEHLMAEFWEAKNIPCRSVNYGRTIVHAILDMHDRKKGELDPHDVQVVTSTMQYLGTSCGRSFLSEFIRYAEILV
tara:strand:- start:2187 stop:2717 length:531 start_codon:yes stop_codon:yes gene_type:complete